MVEWVVTPPGLFLALGLAAWALARRRPRLARTLLLVDGALLALLATPLVSGAWLARLEGAPPLDLGDPRGWAGAGAVVVLGADVDAAAPEVPGGHGPGPLTLQRCHHGARVARATGLPVLVSGGTVLTGAPPVARLMARTLEDDLGVPVAWVEDASADTWHNAVESAARLRGAGVDAVVLVTHAWHVPRARACLEAQGLEVVAAPLGYHRDPVTWPGALVPSLSALRASGWAFHEWWGGLWYALRHGV